MAQIAVRNSQGMATSFQNTQIVNLRSTVSTQILQVFRNIAPGAVYENQPLALVYTRQSPSNRQVNIIKSLMVSPVYWDAQYALAALAVTKKINVYSLTSDFLTRGDRFSRLLDRLSPRQDRYDKMYEIQDDGGTGQVDLGFAFEATSLDVDGATPTGSFPTTGLLSFGGADIGKLISVAFVTQPVFNVMKIIRTNEQENGENVGTEHPDYAHVMHPALAPLLSIPVPTV